MSEDQQCSHIHYTGDRMDIAELAHREILPRMISLIALEPDTINNYLLYYNYLDNIKQFIIMIPVQCHEDPVMDIKF